MAERNLDELLSALGGVVLEGARGTGKTSTGLARARSSVRLDQSPDAVALARTRPSLVLEGSVPRLIDEWQLAPELWNVVRHEIDDRAKPGQFILSGSASPADDIVRHSGIGRIGRVRMRPMSLWEQGVSPGTVSLAELLEGRGALGARTAVTYEDLAAHAVAGGWPATLDLPHAQRERYVRAYVEELVRVEIPEAVGVRHQPDRLMRLLRSLARNVSTEASLASLAADVGADGSPADAKTMRTYLDGLKRVFAAEFLGAWSPQLRSRSRLRSAEKIHLVDPSLACAALGVGADRLARDVQYFGFVFESMVTRDLRVYAAPDDGRVYHYRDNTGLEVDAIIEYPHGAWGAVEVKLGSSRVPEAEANLLKLVNDRVDLARLGAPSFLAVITATEYAYTLDSGVHVIPLALLGP